EEAQRVAGPGQPLLPTEFRSDRVIDFPLRDLRTQFGDRARLIARHRLVVGTPSERLTPQLFERERHDGPLLLGDFDAIALLLPALEDEIRADPVFGRACRFLRIESGPRQIL